MESATTKQLQRMTTLLIIYLSFW